MVVEWLSRDSSSLFVANENSLYASSLSNEPLWIRTSYNPLKLFKDIDRISTQKPPNTTFHFKSYVQRILRNMMNIIGDRPTTESRLQFAQRCIIDKAIEEEKQNYKYAQAYEELDIAHVPKGASIISSNLFFKIKTDGIADKLQLKCRLVPHGNRNREKSNVRSDSPPAQFPVIALVLSFAVVLGFVLLPWVSRVHICKPSLSSETFSHLSPMDGVQHRVRLGNYGNSRMVW